MSDQLPPEVIEAAIQRDHRYREIGLSVGVEAALRDGGHLHILLSKLREDLDETMKEFAHANCGDTVLIQGLQSRVFRFIYALETFEAILARGRMAEESVRMEDQIERGGRYDGA